MNGDIICAVFELFKKNSILIISGILAVVSCFIVHPDQEYIGYINFRVLAILMSLMLVVAMLLRIGTFDFLTDRLLRKLQTSRSIAMLLTVLSFLMAMFLTNDVTLVTLVPFAIAVMKGFNDRKGLMFTLILMTVAANHGQKVTRNGRTIVPMGAVIPANGATAKGILYEDIDVTDGAAEGSVVTEGTVYGDRLPAALAEAAATALTQIRVIAASPTVTRPAAFDVEG